MKEKLPRLEILLGSGQITVAEALRELGYDSPEELIALRKAEDEAEHGK